MESSLCSSDGLLEPSLPARTQPDPGAAPAIYRPPLFQVGNHKKGRYGVETVAMSVFPVVNNHQRHQCVFEISVSRAGFGEGCTTASTEGCILGSLSRTT